jgi:hypothetical protein
VPDPVYCEWRTNPGIQMDRSLSCNYLLQNEKMTAKIVRLETFDPSIKVLSIQRLEIIFTHLPTQ